MRLSIVSLSAAAFGLLVATSQAAPVELKLKFPTGQVDKLSMNMDLDQTISADVLPAPQQQKIKMGMDMTLKVLKSDSDGADVEMTFDRMSMGLNAAGRDMKFDSATDKQSADNPLSGMGAVVGAKLTVHFGPDGKVDKVSGVDEMTKKLSAAAGGGPAAQMVQQAMGEDQIKQQFNSAFAEALPKKPVDKGDTWESTITQNTAGMAMKMKTENKLVDFEEKNGHKIAKIEYSGTGKIEGNAANGPKLKADELTQKGTKTFDLERGFFSNSDMEQKMKGTMSITGPMGDISLKMDQTVNAKITVTPGSK